MLSGYFLAVGEDCGPPLTEDEPERLVDDAVRLDASLQMKVGVDTRHETNKATEDRGRRTLREEQRNEGGRWRR